MSNDTDNTEEMNKEQSYIDIFIGEYSKISALLHDVVERIEDGGSFVVENGNELTADYIQGILDTSGERVNQSILEMKMLSDQDEE